ncbi:MAG: glycine cleavage system protein H [Candidatus Verstraetearchaeota archaeon]|nr:glycine cleavage system protein H [Candidatus Verstraetearchaeota archaeon]
MGNAEHRTSITPLYSKKHVWVRIHNDTVVVGVTDCLQKQLGTIINVEFSSDEFVEKGRPIAWLESIKAVVAVPSPIDCEIVEVNSRLIREPWLVNASPYDEGWIALLRALNVSGLRELKNDEGLL